MIFQLPQQSDAAIDFIQTNTKRKVCRITNPEKYRSVVQNNYYWSILELLETETGTFKDDWHNYFGSKFRRFEKVINNELTEYVKSTTQLTTLEAEDYYSKIRMFASVELGIYVPMPNETVYDYLKL